jgi:hypothetical protein
MNVLDLLGKSVGRVLGKDDLPFKIGEEAGYQSSVWKLYHGIRKVSNVRKTDHCFLSLTIPPCLSLFVKKNP